MIEHSFRTPPPRPPDARRRWRRALTLVVALVPLLSACNVWEQVGRLPNASRFNPEEAAITPNKVASLHDAWSSQVSGSFSEPILADGKLYTTVDGAGGGRVRSYDAATGAVLWDAPVPAPATAGSSGPVVSVGGALWVSRAGGGGSACASLLNRLDPATGNVLTSETTGPAVTGPVVAAGTTAAFVTKPGCSQTGNRARLSVRDLSGATGSWTFSFPDGDFPTPPSIGNGKIYVASGNQVYAFDAAGCGAATCVPVWTTSLDLDGGRVDAAGSRPVIGPDDTVYVGALAGGLQTLVRALDGQTGAHLWRTDVHPGPGPGWQNLALAHGQLYVSDQRHGSPGNALEVFAAEGCGQPVCAPAWSASIDGPPVAGLTVGGDVLYVGLFGQTNSRLVAFDARGCGSATCARLGAVDFGDRQPLHVSVADGRLAVVSAGSAGYSLRVLVPR